ncbi:MAG: hypothetical protein HYY17_09595 [Planctomycetes bacterium]|nr:hypothetical protein [Planctomycetota bacterium]
MPSALETADLWLGAFLLAEGARLAAIRLEGDGRKTAYLLFEGAVDLPALARAYRSGAAAAPVLALRRHMQFLRDELFREIRKEPKEDPEVERCPASKRPSA